MFLRMVTLGLILSTTPIVLAKESPESGHPSILPQQQAHPAPDAPHTSYVQADEAVRDRATNVATSTAPHMLFKVQLLEVSLTKLRDLGINSDWFTYGFVSDSRIRQLIDATGEQANTPRAEPATEAESNDGLRFADWLKANNLAKVLCNPTLATVNGRKATLHVGGEFPVPAKDDSKAAVDFREFGTQMSLLASSLGDNQVQLEVNAKVSAIDYLHAIEINGTRVPGLKVRQFATACKLSFDQTVMLTGLVEQRREARQVDGGQIGETLVDVGLMVVITPELVPPLEAPATTANRNIDRTKRR